MRRVGNNYKNDEEEERSGGTVMRTRKKCVEVDTVMRTRKKCVEVIQLRER